MSSFWFKSRQVVMLDAQSGRPAKNFYIRFVNIGLFLLFLAVTPFALGAWYAPFHSVQEIIPENLKLKRQNTEIKRELADTNTLNVLKDEQLASLKEQLAMQERHVLGLSKELHMFKSILDERKGKGIQLLKSQAFLSLNGTIEWQALLVKGGSYPRYLAGTYELFALGDEGQRLALKDDKMIYRFESHVLLSRDFAWGEIWQPVQIGLVIYNSRKKEVLKQVIDLKGN